MLIVNGAVVNRWILLKMHNTDIDEKIGAALGQIGEALKELAKLGVKSAIKIVHEIKEFAESPGSPAPDKDLDANTKIGGGHS